MSQWATILTVLFIAMILFGLAMVGLGLGVIFKRRALRGHCGGGTPPIGPNGEILRCDTCPNGDDPNAGASQYVQLKPTIKKPEQT